MASYLPECSSHRATVDIREQIVSHFLFQARVREALVVGSVGLLLGALRMGLPGTGWRAPASLRATGSGCHGCGPAPWRRQVQSAVQMRRLDRKWGREKRKGKEARMKRLGEEAGEGESSWSSDQTWLCVQGKLGGGRLEESRVKAALTLQRYPTLTHRCCSTWPMAHAQPTPGSFKWLLPLVCVCVWSCVWVSDSVPLGLWWLSLRVPLIHLYVCTCGRPGLEVWPCVCMCVSSRYVNSSITVPLSLSFRSPP